MDEQGQVTVEFYGIPRYRAGRTELAVRPGTVGEVLNEVTRVCPNLAGLIRADERLAPHYLLSLDGKRFLTDLHEQLASGSRVLLLSADAGG